MLISDITPGTYYIAHGQKVFKGQLKTIECSLTMADEYDEYDFDTKEELDEAIAQEIKLVDDEPLIAELIFSTEDWRGQEITVFKGAKDGMSIEGIFTTKEALLNHLSDVL